MDKIIKIMDLPEAILIERFYPFKECGWYDEDADGNYSEVFIKPFNVSNGDEYIESLLKKNIDLVDLIYKIEPDVEVEGFKVYKKVIC